MELAEPHRKSVPATFKEDENRAVSLEPAARDEAGHKGFDEALLLHLLREATPVAWLVLDEHADILATNRHAGEQLGFTAQELLGRSYPTISHPEDRQRVAELVQSSLARPGETAQAELRKIRQDGSFLWVNERVRAVAGSGAKRFVVAGWEDITERRLGATPICPSEVNYRAIVETVDGLMYVCSPQYRIVFMNGRFIERIGRDATGELCYKALHNLESVCPWCVNERVVRGETVQWEVQNPTNGHWHYVLNAPIRQLDGSIFKQSVIQNITERKRTEEARLRGITDSAQDAILMMDPRGEISFWNPAAESIFGYSAEEAMGKNLHQLLVPERYLAAACAAFPEFQRTGRGIAIGKTLELLAVRKDGVEIAVDLSLSAFSLNGEWHAIGILRDVTERKCHEAELIQAREQAETANRAKSMFLATMSHELRTPLNAILGFAELLELEMADRGISDWHAEIQKIRRAGGHLLELISDVMDLSKIEAGKMELQAEDFDMAPLVREVVTSVEPLAAKNRVEVRVACEPAVVHADHIRVRQCLFNLVGNACKFTQDGQVSIEAGIDSGSDGKSYVVQVADTGIGMSAEDLRKIFSDFTQVDASSTRKYGGTGLGLAISRKLSRLMGGDITVNSAPGVGSTFTLRFPTGQDADPSRGAPAGTVVCSSDTDVERQYRGESWL
jgi:PAS domain S-box-containing protein